MAAETVTVERHGPVLRVRMNRPDKLNAQHPTLITELDAAFAAGAADADVRVIVLSGQGRAFSEPIRRQSPAPAQPAEADDRPGARALRGGGPHARLHV